MATKSSPDEKLLHAAYVIYQYIDNDEDGTPDNELVYSKLVEKKATMIMFKNQKEVESSGDFLIR